MKGKVIAVCRSTERGHPKEDVRSGFLEKGVGLVRDAHSGTAKEVSILLKHKVDELAERTGLSFAPGVFAENLLVEGLEQEELIPGKQLKAGQAVLQIEQIGKDPGIPHTYNYRGYSLLPRYGIFARVVESGVIQNGDSIETIDLYPKPI